jgi:hypothetical protein
MDNKLITDPAVLKILPDHTKAWYCNNSPSASPSIPDNKSELGNAKPGEIIPALPCSSGFPVYELISSKWFFFTIPDGTFIGYSCGTYPFWKPAAEIDPCYYVEPPKK